MGRQEVTKYQVVIYQTQEWTEAAGEKLKSEIFPKEKKLLAALVEAAAEVLPAGVGLIVEADILDDEVDYQDEYRVSRPAHGPCPVKLIQRLDLVAAD